MCDTVVAVLDGRVLFGKNSDREPGEPQAVEHHLPREGGGRVRCTHLEVRDVGRTHEVVISRPVWMWGAEMGANDRGLVIGNEAVFTRFAVPERGLTGMDLLRLALERASTAREAVDVIVALAREHGQGGRMGHRKRSFRYHSSFLLADPTEAWVLDTAGPFWAAARVRGTRSISNALSIGTEFDLLSDGALTHARREGWWRSSGDFDFARAFGAPVLERLSGAAPRAACTSAVVRAAGERAGPATIMTALRDHAGLSPAAGLLMRAPCAHAAPWPTRTSGQTTGSMVSVLEGPSRTHLLTGTSAPCLSAFKPVPLGVGPVELGPTPRDRWDPGSLWWAHELVHRRALGHWETTPGLVRAALDPLEQRALAQGTGATAAGAGELWAEHLALARELGGRLPPSRRSLTPFALHWARQSARDGMPA